MSNHLSSQVYKRNLGTLTRKAVMALLADKASDNGEGIWAAKQTMADELCTSKQTVITTIKGLVADDLLKEVGRRPCQNGYLVEYAINVKALMALALVKSHDDKEKKKGSSSLTGQAALPVKDFDPTGQAPLPDRSSCLTQTPLEPSLNRNPPNPPVGGKRASAPIPADWVLPGIDDLPPEIGALARQWPAGAYQAAGKAFHQHWRGRGTKRPDWSASWAARVQAQHEVVMRGAKAGVSYIGAAAGGGVVADRPPVAAKAREDARSVELHDAVRDTVGAAVWSQWFEPMALLFHDLGLMVVAPSRFHAAQIEANHRGTIDAALTTAGPGVDWVRVIAEQPAAAKKGAARRG